LKQQFPDVFISINGGITDFLQAKQHLDYVDGVMMGREIYSNPFILSNADHVLFNADQTDAKTREQVLIEMTEYIFQQHEQGVRVWHIARHMLGLFQGQIGGKIWRRYLSQNGTGKHNNSRLLLEAYEQVLKAQENALNFSQNH
jgi:tRNA-dihydrouridine synthase A